MLKLKNSTEIKVDSAGCGNFDANCIFCDNDGWWDINKS